MCERVAYEIRFDEEGGAIASRYLGPTWHGRDEDTGEWLSEQSAIRKYLGLSAAKYYCTAEVDIEPEYQRATVYSCIRNRGFRNQTVLVALL